MARRFAVLVIAAIASVWLAAGPTSFAGEVEADSLPVPAFSPADGELQRAIRFREAFGLVADSNYVLLSLDDGAGFPDMEWGIPLSRVEANELARRMEVQGEVQKAIIWADGQPTYAGEYFDHTRGGMPVFLFSGPTSLLETGLEALIPSDVAFEVRSVAVTLHELELTKTEIAKSREMLSGLGVEVLSVSQLKL